MQENPVSDTQFDDDDELTQLMNSFAEKGSGLKNATDTFEAFITAPPYDLANVMQAFLANEPSNILYALRRYDINNVPYENTARLMLVCAYLQPEVLQVYGQFLDENYKEIPVPNPEDVITQLTPTEKSDATKVREFNEKVAKFKREVATINAHNNKISEIKKVVKQYGTVANLGDETLDTTGLPSVYFRFAINDKEDYTSAFIKEAWVIAAGLMQTVGRIKIAEVSLSALEKENSDEDVLENSIKQMANGLGINKIIMGDDEDEIDTSLNDQHGIYDVSGHRDVVLYFRTAEDAQNFEQNKELIDQLHDKYKRYYRER